MANIEEAFMRKVTAGLDEELAMLDKKIAQFTTVETPQSEKLLGDIGNIHNHIDELKDEIELLLSKEQTKKDVAKVRQDEYDQDHLFKSAISPSNPKSLHELYEEMDLLDIDSDDDSDDDDDSGNGMDDADADDVEADDEAGEDEIIFLGKTEEQDKQKISTNKAPVARPVSAKDIGAKNTTPVGSTSGSPQRAPSVPKSTGNTPQIPPSKGAQEPPKVPSTLPLPIPVAKTTTSSGTTSSQPVPATNSKTASRAVPVANQSRVIPAAGGGVSVPSAVPSQGATVPTQGTTAPTQANAGNIQQKGPMRFLMVTTSKNKDGQEVKTVKTLVLQNPHGIPLDGLVVLKIQGADGKMQSVQFQGGKLQQPMQIQHGQPSKGQGTSSQTTLIPVTSPQAVNIHRLQQQQCAAQRPVTTTSASVQPASNVVEIDDDDDDIVMVSSTPATTVAKKSTAGTVRASPKAPSALPAQGGSPGKARQGVQLIHGSDFDQHMMEGEEIMFGDDDATLPELVEGKKVLAKGEENFWFPGTLIGPPIHHKGMKKYKVKFEHGRKRLLSSKFLAVISPSKPGDLAVGIRVVASYLVDDGENNKGMYAGIIAEVPMKTNRGRYLVFFDDGYAQYLSCDKIHIVYHSSACVWADVDIFSREFIREYLDKYPDRSMVSLKKDQVVTTEWNGKWWNARVLEVQGSLAHMLFEATPSRRAETEWIYRGSTRLKPLLDLGDKKNLVSTGPTPEQLRNNLPYVEMTKVHSDHILPEQQIPQPKPQMLGRLNEDVSYSQLLQRYAQQSTGPSSSPSFAKKSTATGIDPAGDLLGSLLESGGRDRDHKKKKKKKNKHKDRRKDKYDDDRDFEPETSSVPSRRDRLRKRYEDDKLYETDTRINLPVRKERLRYIPHMCSPACLGAYPQVVDPTQNPLRAPMDLGWVRELCKEGGGKLKRHVVYRPPCGRSLCSFEDVTRYLKETSAVALTIDRFSFESNVHIPITVRHTRKNSPFYYMELKDLSKGVEKVPVSCVNEFAPDEPPHLTYMTERQAVLRGSKVNTDPDFLVCCDCKDDCADASKCACRQLTIEASACNRDGKPRPDIGYKNRLLDGQIQTGIYECNQRCKCSHQCQNKVVQNGLSLRLQVFKTKDGRGWGIRCLDDIPKGMFVCTYAGQIWDEEEANQKGKDPGGDEYFAELDYIEIVEKRKEGYESDVDPIDSDMSDKDSDDDSNIKTQSSSDEDAHTAQSELSSDDSADMVVSDKRKGDPKESTNQKEQGGGTNATKLVLRRQSESTEQSKWSVSQPTKDMTPPRRGMSIGSSPVTLDNQRLTKRYGYDPSPTKGILDQKQVEAFRQRRQAAKGSRVRQSGGTGNEGKVETKATSITQANEDENDIEIVAVNPPGSSSASSSTKTPVVAMETDEKQDVSDSLGKLGLKEEGEDTKDGIKSEEDREKKPIKAKVTGPRARKSTNSRMRQRYMGSPGSSSQTAIAEKKEMEEEKEDKKSQVINTRRLFGEKHCYVMDAKYMGNLGRYLNHSCKPNLFVQNVFVDSHDLRFPWVAFFADKYIRANTELTWDYAYEVGCVPGKEIICLCNEPECRGRLL